MQSFFPLFSLQIANSGDFWMKNPKYGLSTKGLGPLIMKSRKNLTRFTYETTAFEGWRLCLSRRGTTFTRYFSDKQYGGQRKALQAAESAKKELISIIDSSRIINGKLSKTAIAKGENLLSSL